MPIKVIETPGWNSGARTIDSFSGNGAFQFKVGKSVGVICGLNDQDSSARYEEIDHAFFIESGRYKIIEKGSIRKTSASYTAGSIFKITRINGVVRYFIENALVYTSFTKSYGTVFGDCSLYAYLDEVLDAEIIDYATASISSEDEYNNGDIDIGLRVFGTDLADGNFSNIDLGLTAEGSGISLNKADVDLGLWMFGSDLTDTNIGHINLGFTATGSDLAEVRPEYNYGNIDLGFSVYGVSSRLENNYGDIELSFIASGFDGTPDFNYGNIDLGFTVTAFEGYKNILVSQWGDWSAVIRDWLNGAEVVLEFFAEGRTGYPPDIIGASALDVPAPILTAHANSRDNIQLEVTVPAPTLVAYSGGIVKLIVPAPSLAPIGYVEAVFVANLVVPAPELTATAFTMVGASVEIEVPSPILQASTGAYASLGVLAPVLTAAGKVNGIAFADLAIPAPELTASGTVGGVATVTLSVPVPILEAAGIVGAIAHVEMAVLAPILTASGAGVVSETTYAVNLTTGAVTTLLLGEVDKLVLAHGRLYGLRSGNLMRLDGDLDGAATIPASVRFAPYTFDTNRAKRISEVYFSTREVDGLTVDVVADEKVAWRYQTITDNSRAYGTHKVEIGRGVKFHTAGLVVYNRDGGRMDIGSVELLVQPLSRRPKT
jgi:hypothetical protein